MSRFACGVASKKERFPRVSGDEPSPTSDALLSLAVFPA